MEELTTIIQETTSAEEALQQVFKESIVTSTIDGFYQAFLILWPYLLIAVAIFILRIIVAKRKKKRK